MHSQCFRIPNHLRAQTRTVPGGQYLLLLERGRSPALAFSSVGCAASSVPTSYPGSARLDRGLHVLKEPSFCGSLASTSRSSRLAGGPQPVKEAPFCGSLAATAVPSKSSPSRWGVVMVSESAASRSSPSREVGSMVSTTTGECADCSKAEEMTVEKKAALLSVEDGERPRQRQWFWNASQSFSVPGGQPSSAVNRH